MPCSIGSSAICYEDTTKWGEDARLVADGRSRVNGHQLQGAATYQGNELIIRYRIV